MSGVEDGYDWKERHYEAYYLLDHPDYSFAAEETIAKFKEAYLQCKQICRIEICTGVNGFARPDRVFYW